MNWFISDTHFNHSNILKYCNRPFQSAKEMDTVILNNINKVVEPKDTLWHLGDFSLRGYHLSGVEYYRKQILCQDVRLITGNHDKTIIKYWKRGQCNLFSQIYHQYYSGYIENIYFVLLHRPPQVNIGEHAVLIREIKLHPDLVWFHGHTHNNSCITPHNLSVENTEYKPICLPRLLERIK